MSTPSLSLYVHLPWCVRKCPYCDFNSHTAGDNAPRRRYLDAVLQDLSIEAERARDRVVETVFLGGGTPSLFTPDEIALLLGGIGDRFELADDAEITMEANPGTVECGDPAGYRAAGVNRLSIGAQSFDDDALARLGRIHSSDDIRRAFDAAVDADFDNINIDLMHGLPGQDLEGGLADVRSAIALGPTHLSWYQLTLEPNTVFHARPPADLPDEDTAVDIQDRGHALLELAGFEQYEVSAYARDGRACRHNMNYWQFGDYLAVGAGAHGKITTPEGVFRYAKPANPLQYMQTAEQGAALAEPAKLPGDALVFEFLLNAVRLVAGFSESLLCERAGLDAEDTAALMAPVVEKGLIARMPDGRWRPTELGRRFLNDLQAEFLPDEAHGRP